MQQYQLEVSNLEEGPIKQQLIELLNQLDASLQKLQAQVNTVTHDKRTAEMLQVELNMAHKGIEVYNMLVYATVCLRNEYMVGLFPHATSQPVYKLLKEVNPNEVIKANLYQKYKDIWLAGSIDKEL